MARACSPKPHAKAGEGGLSDTLSRDQHGPADMSHPRRARGRALVTPKREANAPSPGAEERRGFFFFEA